MVGWDRFLVLGFYFIVCYFQAQKLDTANGKIYIYFNNDSFPNYVLDMSQIKYGHSNIKVKEKLGSYHVKFNDVNSIKDYKIIRKTDRLLFWKNGEKEIQLLLTSIDDALFKVQLSSNQNVNHWAFSVERLQNEQPQGGGIQFSEYATYNKKWINLSQENGIGRGGGAISKWTKLAGVAGENYATYAPSPRFFTTQNRFFEWNEFAYSEATFTNDVISFTVLDQSVDMTLGIAPKEVNTSFAYKLPDWSLGSILGLQGGSKEVLDKVSRVINGGAHVDAVWIQDWVGKRATKFGSRLNWTWELDTVHYPNFGEFKAQLEQQNIKILGYVNPFFAEEGKYITQGLQKDYFVKDKNNASILFNYGGMDGYMLDLFNPEAYAWMKQIIQTNLVENGFSGWMADFAEWYPINVDDDIVLGLKKHNEYPVLWAKLNYEVIQESGKELFFFNRSGGINTPKYSSMMWAGDQMVDYSEEDGLLSVFDAYLSSSHSGFPILHSDAGGYTSVKKPFIKNYIRDTLLLKDWLFLEACTPTLRTHEGLLPKDNAQVYDKEMLHYFGEITQLHNALLPYFREMLYSNRDIKTPIFSDASQLNEVFKNQKSIAVGKDLIILFFDRKNIFDLPQDWLFLYPNKTFSTSPVPNMNIQVLVKKGSVIHKLKP